MSFGLPVASTEQESLVLDLGEPEAGYSGNKYEITGEHPARCVNVAMVKGNDGGSQVMFEFELTEPSRGGLKFTRRLPYPKMKTFVELTAKAMNVFRDGTTNNLDVAACIGKTCDVVLERKPSPNGKTYTNIVRVNPSRAPAPTASSGPSIL